MKRIWILAGIAALVVCALLEIRYLWHRQAPVADVATQPGTTVKKERKILYYWDSMLGPSSIRHAPGKSSMGMDLTPVYEDDTTAGPAVQIDPAIVQNMGVRTAEVVRGPLEKTVRAVGMLQVPEPGMHDVTVKIGGYVQTLYADTDGMAVAKGQVLFDFFSPDLQGAERELIAAEQSGAEADLVDAIKQKLRLWDVAETDIDAIAGMKEAPRTTPLRSPADGHVVEKAVVQGSAITAGMKVMRIEDHAKLWLDVQVYEEDISRVALGQMVNATVDALPEKMFSGPITFIYPHLDHMARTAMVRVVLDNPNHELSPGMFATANIISRPVADAVWVPREAVIDTGTRQIAFVDTGQGHYEPRKVRMGLVGDDDRAQILEGLSVGEMVVTSGQFLLDVESRTTEAIDKLQQSPPTGGQSGTDGRMP